MPAVLSSIPRAIQTPDLSSKKEGVTFLYSGKDFKLLKELTGAVESAKKTVDIFTYTFSSKSVTKALNKMVEKGVVVKLHIDSDKVTNRQREILHPGVHIIPHQISSGHFHHKTVIVDDHLMLVGTGNCTEVAYTKQLNSFVKVDDKAFVSKVKEFYKNTNPKGYVIKGKIQNQEVEFWHMPSSLRKLTTNPAKQNVLAQNRILEMIEKAEKTIWVANNHFSNRKLAEGLLEAKKRGVDVQFFYEPDSLDSFSRTILEKFAAAKIKVIPNKNPGLMHLKWMLVDQKSQWIGSPNWSLQAFAQNDESFCILNSLSAKQKKEMQNYWEEITQY